MTEMTGAEIRRAFDANDKEHDKFVTKELHQEVVAGLRDDLQRVEGTLNKLIWAVVAVFFTVVGQAIVAVVQSGVG